jgi:PKD repeat protein
MQIGHVRILLTGCLLMVGAVVSPLGVEAAVAQPSADFDWAPKPVVSGTPVTFTSTSIPSDASTPISSTRWEFDGDRKFDAKSPDGTATVTAPAPGTWKVTLHVEDVAGESDRETKEIAVGPTPSVPPPDPPPPPPNQPPNAAFAVLPGSPLVGEEVTFVSYSDDADGSITGQSWDMNGDGIFDDATGPIATRRFPVPGERMVTLRVTDDRGATSTLSLAVVVREGHAATTAQPSSSSSQPSSGPTPLAIPLTGPTPLPRFVSPFPIVRLVGSVTPSGTRIRLLSVQAPRGARASVRCRGRGCPVKRAERVVGRGPVRFAVLERLMPARMVLDVLVHQGDRIGKYTRFELRHNRRPRRADGCLWPGTTRMAPCPAA